ncbi:hypothetical protein K438DRAFT_1979137 [Mycena galopus ATCC 62051]|nr:hypothetical protein K438DRAFT_1979137 [Mycena galopus ATCC 62051]
MAQADPAFDIIDDQDPSVKYTGTWVVGGTVHEHDDTVSSSVQVGNNFLVPFTGTAIAVYGTYDAGSAGVQTSYAIDGGTPTTVTSTSSPNDSYQQLFWQSGPVSSGAHSLVVTMVAVNTNQGAGEGTIWFDYFNVTTDATTDISNTASPSTSASQSKSSSASHTEGSSTATSPTSSSTSAGTTAARASSHTSIIAGVIIAVVVVILVAGAVFRRRRRAARQYFGTVPLSPPSMSNGPPPTQPFLPGTPMTPMSGLPGSAPMATSYDAPAGAPYTPGGGAVDPRQSYAMPSRGSFGQANTYAPVPPQGFPTSAPYDPYASAGASMTSPQSSYAPSVSSIPSSSSPNRGPLSVVGGFSTVDSDSVAELKRRQQQVVNQYEQGIGGSAPVIQHTDSGVRSLEPIAGPATELPPVYSAT